ncbi:hypothetical protein D3C81_1878790 [compost metagenome]
MHARRLAHQFIAGAARQEDEAVVHGDAVQGQVADQFIQAVMPAHILEHFHDGALGRAPGGSMHAARLVHQLLVGQQFARGAAEDGAAGDQRR